MRAVSVIVSVLLAGSAFAQDSAAVYTPTQRDVAVPTYVNATVVRVDTRHDTITFRSESGEVSLTAEGDAVAGLRKLRPGDEVLLGFRVDDRTGRPVQVVTAILAGEEMAQRGSVSTSTPAATSSVSSVSGRVVGADPAAGTLTLVDAEGRTESLSVQGASALGALAAVNPGDQVDVSFVPGSAAFAGGGVIAGVTTVGGSFGAVNAIQPVATPNFVTGRVTTIDNSTGALTLRTAFGDQVFTLPAAGAGRLVAGQDVRLDLNGTRSFTTSAPLVTTGATTTTGIIGSDNNRSLTGTTGTLRSTRTSGTVNTTRGTFATPLGSGQGSANTSGRTGMVQPTSAPRTTTTRMLGSNDTQSRGTVTNFGRETGTVASVATATGTVGGVSTVAGRSAIGNTGQAAGAPTTTATVAGVVPSAATLPNTTATAGAPTTPLGTLSGQGTANGGVGTTTTGTLAGTAAVNGVAGVNGVSNVAGQTGTATAGVNTGTDNLAPGTFTTGASPLNSVIPSLPSAVGQLNVVPPPTAAPALASELPVGAARDLATRDYDNAVRTMALKANEIDAHWFRYRDGCLRSNALTADIDRNLYSPGRDREWFVLFTGDVRTPADDNCRQLMIEMTRMADDWRDTMTRVEETARKNDVLPGAMREARQRYRVEF